MVRMTRKERLEAIVAGRIPDRPAIKVWGATPGQACVHPAFVPVRDLAAQYTDLMLGASSPFHIYCGQHSVNLIESETQPTSSPEWVNQVTTYHTPDGALQSTFRASTVGKPGYEQEHLLKEPADIGKLLSLPYTPYPITLKDVEHTSANLGDAGIVLYGLDHAAYALERLIGSENFALWSLDAPEQILEAITVFQQRLRAHVEATLAAGYRGLVGWVGPELCIPPLLPPSTFDEYVTAIDAPLIDLLHEGGCRVWVHCHGKMRPVLKRFLAMGVDVLNPIEPPPMGDITLEEAFACVGDAMALEGNIETHDLMTATTDEIRAQVHAVLDQGANHRFILCPSSGYMENINPTAGEIENWRLFITEGVRYADTLAC